LMNSPPEIMDCLSRGDFASFVSHLEGLRAVYDLSPASAPEKSRAWNALSCVEKDLEVTFNSYRAWPYPSVLSLLHSTPLGLVHPRRGGLPMKLRYFLPPGDLVSSCKGTAGGDVTEALLVDRDLGLTVTLMMEKSATQCLMPTASLVSGLDHNGVPVLEKEMVAANGNW
jgi:mediator of RNA polymerase II transcription subunit 1